VQIDLEKSEYYRQSYGCQPGNCYEFDRKSELAFREHYKKLGYKIGLGKMGKYAMVDPSSHEPSGRYFTISGLPYRFEIPED
jgi:hypothetical protein